MPAMQFRTVNSPLGPLTLAGKDGRLMHLVMSTRPMSRVMAVGSVVPCHRVIGCQWQPHRVRRWVGTKKDSAGTRKRPDSILTPTSLKIVATSWAPSEHRT